MPFEELVCSKNLSEQLSQLLNYPAHFYWWVQSGDTKLINQHEYNQYRVLRWVQYFYPTYTASELLKLLPESIVTPTGEELFVIISFGDKTTTENYVAGTKSIHPNIKKRQYFVTIGHQVFSSGILADVYAMALIHLITLYNYKA